MRLLVTGVTGQLGSVLAPALRQRGHSVIATDRARMDFSRPVAAAALVAAERPDWVINCAAYTQVDRAEEQPQQAMCINRDTPALLARTVAGYGGRMLQVSTDFVFDGVASRPYLETDTPHPLGAYGHSKLEGEEAVQAALPEAIVLRTAWVYGVHGHNFVNTMLRLAGEGRPLRVVDDQTGTPTWTRDIVTAITALVEQDASGIFHFTASGQTSWCGFAKAILEEAAAAGLPVKTRQATPITTTDYPTAATRPAWSVLDTERIRPLLPAPIPHWRDSLRAMLQEYRTCADC